MVFLINSMGEGGAQRVLLSLVDEYLASEMKVTVISLAKNNFYELPDAVTKIYLNKKSNESYGFYETLLIPYYAWKLKRYVSLHKLERVQSHLFRANFVNLIARVFAAKHRVQIVNHSVISRFFKEGLSGRVNLFLINVLYPKADKIIYISKRMKEDFLKHVKGIDKKNSIIYNPYDIDGIIQQANETNRDFIFDESKFYLITVGRLISLKRYEDVLQALTCLDKKVELIMLGDGENREKLENLVKELGLVGRVHFLGQVKNPFFYMAGSQLLISASSVEGFPNVLVEAMVCRTAIISTDCVSGPREILAPSSDHKYQLKKGLEMAEFGVLYVVGDVEGLTQAIKSLMDNSQLRKAYEDKAFEQSKNLSIKKIAKIYRECYFQ